jgi:hypothetical protein
VVVIVQMMLVMFDGNLDVNVNLTCSPKCDRVACRTREEACRSSARLQHKFKLKESFEV